MASVIIAVFGDIRKVNVGNLVEVHTTEQTVAITTKTIMMLKIVNLAVIVEVQTFSNFHYNLVVLPK